jgi:hypothetical protein
LTMEIDFCIEALKLYHPRDYAWDNLEWLLELQASRDQTPASRRQREALENRF